MRLLEFFGPQQRVGQVDEQPRGHDPGKPVVEDHVSLLEPVAGDGVTDGQDKKAKSKAE
jgi:hypothetical protein